MQNITNAQYFNNTKKIQQIVSEVNSEIIQINPNLVSAKFAKENFSVYCDWSKIFGRKLDSLSTFCRALIIDGKNISTKLSDKKIILKGIGLVKDTYWEETFREHNKHPLIVNVQDETCPNIWMLGTLNKINAMHEWNITEYLNKNNISTHSNVAILKLDEIINETGTKLKLNRRTINKIPSIVTGVDKKELKEFKRNFVPCIYVSAHDADSFMRLNDASINDVKKYISQKNITLKNYQEWFVKTIATNLAKIHNLFLIHGAYTPMNIKLDGSFTDNEDFIGTSYLFYCKDSLLKEQESFSVNERTKRIEKRLNKSKQSIHRNIYLYYQDEMFYGLHTTNFFCDKLNISEKKSVNMRNLFLDIYFDNRESNGEYYGYYNKLSAKKKLKEKFCF